MTVTIVSTAILVVLLKPGLRARTKLYRQHEHHLSCSRNCLKGVILGLYSVQGLGLNFLKGILDRGTYGVFAIGLIKQDSRSVDYCGSFVLCLRLFDGRPWLLLLISKSCRTLVYHSISIPKVYIYIYIYVLRSRRISDIHQMAVLL